MKSNGPFSFTRMGDVRWRPEMHIGVPGDARALHHLIQAAAAVLDGDRAVDLDHDLDPRRCPGAARDADNPAARSEIPCGLRSAVSAIRLWFSRSALNLGDSSCCVRSLSVSHRASSMRTSS